MPHKKPTSTVMLVISKLAPVIAVVISIITIVAGIYGFTHFIDVRIERAVNNEEFIRRVASHVRPYVIFDENSSILVDGGGMQYLEEIEVGKLTERDYTIEVIVTPKHHLANAPLIEALSKYEIFVVPERGRGHQWIYEMRIETVRDSGRGEVLLPARFRLEILR